jgi:hypothetical protein
LGDLKAALEIAETLANDTRGNQQKVFALERIGIAQAEAGDVAGVVRTLTAIDTAIDQDQHHPPRDNAGSRAEVLQAVALAQEKAGDRAAARATVQKLRRLADKLPPEGPRRGFDVTWARIVEAVVVTQVRLGDIEGALGTAFALPASYPKAKALLAIGKAQVEAGELADARETLSRPAFVVENSPLFGAGGYGTRSRSGPSWKTDTLSRIAEQQ